MTLEADPPSSISVRVMLLVLLVGVAHADEFEGIAAVAPRASLSAQVGIVGVEDAYVTVLVEGTYYVHANWGLHMRASTGGLLVLYADGSGTRKDLCAGIETRTCGGIVCGFVDVDVGVLDEQCEGDGVCARPVGTAVVWGPRLGLDFRSGPIAFRIAAEGDHVPGVGVGGGLTLGLAWYIDDADGERRRSTAKQLGREAIDAARLGDCDRAVALELRVGDPAIRRRVARDPEVARCLSAPRRGVRRSRSSPSRSRRRTAR